MGFRLFAHIGLHRQGAAVVVVKTVEGNAAVVYAAHLAVFGEALVIQTGVVQLAVFVDIHEAARRCAAKVELAVEDDRALHLQGGAGNGFLTAVIGQAEGKDLDQPLGGGFGLGLGAALHNVLVVDIGSAGRDLHVLARHICHGGDIDLCYDKICRVAAVDHHVGLGCCLAGGAGDLCGSHGVVVHLGGLGLNIELVDTAEEHIVKADDLLVVHGVDVRAGRCGGACGNRGGACVGVELLNNVGNHLGVPCVDIGLLCPGVVGAQADVGGDLYGHVRFTGVAARKALHIPVGVCGGLGGVGCLYLQLAEESGDLSALRHVDGGGAGLLHRGPGATAGQDDAAAVHIQVSVHVRLGFVAAEDIHISVSGSQTGVFADADGLVTLPGQADACVAVLGKSHIGGVDDAVEVHIGVGQQVDVPQGFRLCVFAHIHGALLGHLHIDQVGAAGDKADTGAVHGRIGFHLVGSLDKQLVAREDSAVQVSRGGLVPYRVDKFVAGNVHRANARCLVGAGIHLCIAFSRGGHIAAGVDDRPCAQTGLGGVAQNGGLGLNDLAVQAAQSGGGNPRPGNQLVDLSGGTGRSLDADAACLDLRIAVSISLGGHLFDLGMGKDQAQCRQAGRGVACLRLGGDLHGVGLRQNRHSAGSMDGHIALDEGGVAHLDIGKGPLLCAADQADAGAAAFLVALGAVAAQFGGGGGIVHRRADIDKPGSAYGSFAHQIGFLGHVQPGLGLVHADLNTAYLDLFAVHVRLGKAAAAVHLNAQIAGGHFAAALYAAAGCGIGDGSGRVACAADRVCRDAAVGLGGLGGGIGLILELDADIGCINIGSGAVQICLKAAARSGVHHHDAQIGGIGAERTLIVVGKGIALGHRQDIQLAAGLVDAGLAGCAEAGAGNISLVRGGDPGVRRVAAEICAADVDIGGLQHGLCAFVGAAGGQTGVVEQRGNADVVICLYAAAGDEGALRGRDRGIDIADQQLVPGNAGLGCGNGSICGCGAVGNNLNAVAGAGNCPCCGHIASADGRGVGCSRCRVGQIHLAADKVYADLGLLPGGLSPGGKFTADLQRRGLDGAAADLRLEAAVGGGFNLDCADVYQAQRDVGHFGAGFGIAGGFAYDADRAAAGNLCVADACAADSGGTGFYRVDSQTSQLHVEIAGGGAAKRGGGALGKALIQLAAKGHAGRVKACAPDIGGLLCRQLRGDHIHCHTDAGDFRRCLGNTGVRQCGAAGFHRRSAGNGNGAAALDACLGLCADHSLGHVGLRADGICIHAAQRLGGFRRSLSGIGVGHFKALHIDHSTGAVDKGTEAARGFTPDDGDSSSHITGLHIGLLHAGVGNAGGIGLQLQRLGVGKNAGSGHGGLIHGIVFRIGGVAGKAVLFELDRNDLAICVFYADRSGIGESCLCALPFSVIEEGLNGDISVIYGDAVQLGLVGGVQQSHCHIRRHIHTAHLEGGGIDDGFRKSGAVCLHVHQACGDAAAAVDFGKGVGACVADSHVGLDASQIGAYTARAGSQMGNGVCGVARLNVDGVRRKAAALIQTEICLENALRVGIAGHDPCGYGREILIGDLRKGIGAAGGDHLHLASGKGEAVRGHAGNGAGAAVSHCHICLNAVYCAAAGDQGRLGALAAFAAVEHTLYSEAAARDVSALNAGLLAAAEHRYGNTCRDVLHADVQTGYRGFRGGLAHGQHLNGAGAELRRSIAQDTGQVYAVIVGNGNIQAAGDGAHVVADRQGLGLCAVGVLFVAGSNADAARCHVHAGGVQDCAVLCAQVRVAYAGAHRNGACACAAEFAYRFCVHLRIHDDGRCRNILPDDGCQGVGVVKAQKSVHSYACNAAGCAEDKGGTAARHIILYLNCRLACIDLAGLAACPGGAGGHADIGVDPGADDGDRSGNACARSAAFGAHEPCIGLGVGGALYRKAGQGAVDGHVLAHIGVDLHTVDHSGHTRVDSRHAAGDRDGSRGGFDVGAGADGNGADPGDIHVPCDIGLSLALVINHGKEGVDRCHAAGGCAGDAEDAGIVAVGRDADGRGLQHICHQIGDGVVAQDNDGAGDGHARHTACACNGHRADGAGAEIQLIVVILVLYQVGDAVVSLLLAAVLALGLFHGAGLCLDRDLALCCAERCALVHTGDHIAVHHVHCQGRGNACDAAGHGACQHVGADQLCGEHLDVSASRDADAAADNRGDRAAGSVLGPGDGRGLAQILIIVFVYFKVFAPICVVGACFYIIIEVSADVSAFGVKLAVLAGNIDAGLLYAVAFQLIAQVIHAVVCGKAAGGLERVVHKAIRVKAAQQCIGGILRQLTAGNGHHDCGAHTGCAACRRGRVAEHIPSGVGLNGHAAGKINFVLSCLAAQETCGNGVMQYGDNRRHAHACRAGSADRDRNGQDLGIVKGGNVQLVGRDGHVLFGLGTGDLVGDDDIHRTGDRGRAAAAAACNVGADELRGVRGQLYIAAGRDVRAFAELRHGAALEPGDHGHRADSHGAAAGNGCRQVDQIGAALCRDIHIATGGHGAAQACQQVVFKGQRACAYADRGGAAAGKAESQQVQLVGRSCLGLDIAGCAHASAGTHARFHVLIIDHGHNGGAYAHGAAGRNAAGKVIYLCFVRTF